jgi:hypothetical protein
MFRGIKCTLDTAIHDNFYSSYVQLQQCHWHFRFKSLEWDLLESKRMLSQRYEDTRF